MFKKDSDHQFIEELLENGQLKRYLKGRTLGKGGFAECYQLISEQTGKHYAAKVIDKQTLSKGKAKEKLQSEILIHKSLRHQNIVKFQHFFQDHQYVYILLELCSNSTLNELAKRRKILTEAEVKYYLWQLLQALTYIHHNLVIHRDLKLGNFFLNDQLQLKVGDFGLATTLCSPSERRKTVCGTPNYIAPEIIDGKRGHSYEVDIWSTGVIAYTLLFGKPPFQTNEVKNTYEKIKACDYSFPKANVSDLAKDFIKQMLVLNPGERATISDLLSHEFMNHSQIPKTLPLSTLACPPSQALLKQLTSDACFLNSSRKSKGSIDAQIKSSRTSKDSVKYQGLAVADKFDSVRNGSKQGKTDRSHGSMVRISSAATLQLRKKPLPQGKEGGSLVYISFFQEQSKYGMFYSLNQKMIGMRFNDQTSLICNQQLTKFKYIALEHNVQTQTMLFGAGEEPQILSKKTKIINHFSKLLEPQYKDSIPSNPITKLKQNNLGLRIYLKHYYITTHYTLFWLSNGTFQASFKDNEKMIIDSHQTVHYIKDGLKSSFKESNIYSQREQIKQKYQHMQVVIKKVKNKYSCGQVKAQKEKENSMAHSSSQVKSVKRAESKGSLTKQFNSTSNLHGLRRPLLDYCSNRKDCSAKGKQV